MKREKPDFFLLGGQKAPSARHQSLVVTWRASWVQRVQLWKHAASKEGPAMDTFPYPGLLEQHTLSLFTWWTRG